MILKGRIVGVGHSKSEKVEYVFQPEVFQPEEIADIQADAESIGDFLSQRDKNGRYPMLRFDSPIARAQKGNPSDAFSVGYLLMERKELITIHLDGCMTNSNSTFTGTVDSMHIGVGYEKEGK